MPDKIPHDSAMHHVSGRSVYINDMQVAGLLLGRIIYSPHAHALIKNIDIAEASKIKGVCAILTAPDIPGKNQMGPVVHDEPCLAEKEVVFCGQSIVILAGENESCLIEAEKKIKISYEILPAITDLETAMNSSHTISPVRKIEKGDVDKSLKSSEHKYSGRLCTNGQEHWYLETQTALAVPGEGSEMTIHASSQNPSETQAIVAEVLGLPKNEIEVEVKRMGGAFGGKETQGNHVAAWAALLARQCRRPVKIHLFRDDDQIMTGKRHRFISDFEIGFDDQGLINAYRVELNADAGAATDLTMAILERAMLHAENAYHIPNIRITGKAWKTNLPSNTAFRGFGGPQGIAVIENAIDYIARKLKIDPAIVRKRNFYQDGKQHYTPYRQEITHCHLSLLYNKLIQSSSYFERRKEVNEFNKSHRFVKRGLALTPVKFGISFTTSFLNQAGALVNVYTDGSVLVSHGGTEMGQGLHTKIRQIAALELGVSLDKVRVNATNTAKVPNTAATAASSGSDLNGMAVKNAIDILKARLTPLAVELLEQKGIKATHEEILMKDNRISSGQNLNIFVSFPELTNLAFVRQISLSATGYYKTPDIHFDREKGTGHPFYYFSYGMAVSEVETDLLTGKYKLLRSDIIHEVGESINPGLDKGQIEGAFIQGVGWVSTEELKWDKEGHLLTHSPDTYKIPTIADIPAEFNVEILENVPHIGTIRRSKAVGEPPFMLAFSVWLAIKDSISASGNHDTEPEFSLPATPEVTLLSVEKIKNRK